jgi:hypothetical protein
MNLHSWILWVGMFGSNCRDSNKKCFCLGLTVFQVLMCMFHQVESCKAMDTPCCKLEWFVCTYCYHCSPCGVPQDLLCSSSLCLCYHWIIFFIGVYEVCLWGVYWISFLLFQVQEVDGHKLVQICNPWVNEVERNGPWLEMFLKWTQYRPQVLLVQTHLACYLMWMSFEK